MNLENKLIWLNEFYSKEKLQELGDYCLDLSLEEKNQGKLKGNIGLRVQQLRKQVIDYIDKETRKNLNKGEQDLIIPKNIPKVVARGDYLRAILFKTISNKRMIYTNGIKADFNTFFPTSLFFYPLNQNKEARFIVKKEDSNYLLIGMVYDKSDRKCLALEKRRLPDYDDVRGTILSWLNFYKREK